MNRMRATSGHGEAKLSSMSVNEPHIRAHTLMINSLLPAPCPLFSSWPSSTLIQTAGLEASDHHGHIMCVNVDAFGV